MGKPKAPKVFDYLYSLDLAWCHGPVDSLNKLWVKDKSIFCGSLRGRRNICVDQPDLFGGDEKEGGVVGTVEFYPGTVDQISSAELARREDRTPEEYPGYRGICHTFFRGPMGRDVGFQWATNNPYLPATEAHFTRIPRQLNSIHSTIWPAGTDNAGGSGTAGEDWNITFEPSGRVFRYNLGPFPSGGGGTAVSLARMRVDVPAVRGVSEFCDSGDERAGTLLSNFDEFRLGLDGQLRGEETTVLPLDVDVDAGQVRFRLYARAWSNAWTAGQSLLRIQAFAGVIDPETGELVPGASLPTLGGQGVQFGPSHSTPLYTEWDHEITGTLPAATRFVAIGAGFNAGMFGTGGFLGTEAYLEWDEVDPVFCDTDGALGVLPDANPAHILYEVKTNADWGQGEVPEMIDVDSFAACAETLYDEEFGLSLGWFRQSTVESFAQEILDHIKGFLFQNPRTGLWQMRLLRDDYDRNTLGWLTPENSRIVNPKRKTWGETVNEIVVTYTDPATEEEATVTAHNLANIQVQGGINSESRNYYGVRNGTLAQRLANRDVIEAGTPLWSGVAEVDRSFWETLPGDVFKLALPEEGIAETIVRVMKIERGTPQERMIRLHLTEDIFGVDALTFTTFQGSLSTEFSPRPTALPLADTFAYPLPLASILNLDDGSLGDPDESRPDVAVALLAHAGPQVIDVSVLSNLPDGLGGESAQVTARVSPVPRSALTEIFYDEPESDNLSRSVVLDAGGGTLRAGDLLILGSSLADHEIIQLVSYDSRRLAWTVARGVYDTVPRQWPVETPVWAHPNSLDGLDENARDGSESVTYWWLPRTSRGRLPASAAPSTIWPMLERPHRPARPANCQIEGLGTLPYEYGFASLPATLNLTWANRNRFADEATPVRWAAPDAPTETGQTVTIRVIDEDGIIVHEVSGLSGTSHELDTSFATSTLTNFSVEFRAVAEDGTESLMGARRIVRAQGFGWGFGWGEDFGQATPPDPFEPDGADAAVWDEVSAGASHVFSEADIRVTNSGGGGNYRAWVLSEESLPVTGKPVYWEIECVAGTADFNGYLGIVADADLDLNTGTSNPILGSAIGYRGLGELRTGHPDFPRLESRLDFEDLLTFGVGDVVMFTFDPVSRSLWIGVNGAWVHNRKPGFTGPFFRSMVERDPATYRIVGQTRGTSDSIRLKTRREDFTYPLPDACDPYMLPE